MNHSFKIALIFTLFSISASAQDIKKEVLKKETKIDMFSSKTGTIVKFNDTKLTPIKVGGLAAYLVETKIRKVTANGESQYFYQIEKIAPPLRFTASIEYSDLLEVIKAADALSEEIGKDTQLNSDYLENKFTTEDGFQLGYFIISGKVTWYLKLEKYTSDSFIAIRDTQSIVSLLFEAKSKIEELKK
jgi:hypothetical protein